MQARYEICKIINQKTGLVKLDLNEYDYAHCDEINTLQVSESLTLYPNVYDEEFTELYRNLATVNKVSTENIILTAGSDESLQTIVNCFVDADTIVFIFTPTYVNFQHMIKCQKTKKIIQIPLNITQDTNIIDLLYPYSGFLKNEKCIVYIVNPNNPLGKLITDIDDCIALYSKALFVVDEAYIEFSQSDSIVQSNGSELYDNLIVVRTFSKAYGLAGLRLGYSIAKKELINHMRNIYNQKNVTNIAVRAGNIIMRNNQFYSTVISTLKTERNKFAKLLTQLNIYHVSSEGNFILIYVGKNADLLLKNAEKCNMHFRNRCSLPNLAGFIRISIGNPQSMERVFTFVKNNVRLFDRGKPFVLNFREKEFIGKVKSLLFALMQVFEKNDFTYWADSGTLLGAIRHEGMIPWDDDADLAYFARDDAVLQRLGKEMEAVGMRLRRNRTDRYWQVEWMHDALSSGVISPVHVDLFPMMSCGDNEHIMNVDERFRDPCVKNFRCNVRYHIKRSFPLIKKPFYHIEIPCPVNYDECLGTALGSDYMTIACINEVKYSLSEMNISAG